ncbi:MAG: helix-turn-helix transcriptional regulator [Polyangia bacterium]
MSAPGSLLRGIERAEELRRRASAIEEELDLLLPAARRAPADEPPRDDPGRPPPDEESLAAAIGSNICAWRKRRGLTQRDLAEATGIRRPNVARLERGSTLPNLSTARRVAAGLGISLKTLLEVPGDQVSKVKPPSP